MRTKIVLAAATVLMLAIGVTAIASNMGFKITISLQAGGYSNWVALPYYNSYTDAQSVFSDVPNCLQVSRWDNSTTTYQTLGARGGVDFTITPGEAYLIKVTTLTNWIVVGSNNPSLSISLNSSGQSNWISVPYNTTATDASSLFTQIPNCLQVSRWDNSSQTYQTYGARGGVNFSLTPGEGLLVKVTSPSSFSPPHY